MTQVRKNILISLEKKYADDIISGNKTVELRNRRMNLSKGDKIWVYSKQPQGSVVMVTTVKAIDKGSPESLWHQYQKICGITEREFFAYFSGVKIGHAISLYEIEPFRYPVPLEKIRKKDKKFHPPQFSKYLDGVPLLSFLENCLIKA